VDDAHDDGRPVHLRGGDDDHRSGDPDGTTGGQPLLPEDGADLAKSATAGSVAGAATGGLIGGPPGVVVGAVTGAVRGVLLKGVADKVDEMAAAKGREIADTLVGPPDDDAEPRPA
jgi:hypothetical protein